MSIAFIKAFRARLTNVPLRWVLTLPYVVPMVGAFLIIGCLSHRNGQMTVEALGQQLMAESNERVIQALEAHLQPPHQINQLHSNSVQQGRLDLQDLPALEVKLFSTLEQFEAVSAVLFVSSSGTLRLVERLPALPRQQSEFFLATADPPITDQLQIYRMTDQGTRGNQVATNEGLDVRRDRPWYSRAVSTRAPGWSAIARYGPYKSLTLTASQPVFDEATKRLLGVFAVHIRLDTLDDFLRQLEISQAGRVLILEADGMVVATSTPETFYQFPSGAENSDSFQRQRITESTDSLTQALGKHLGDRLEDLSTSGQPQIMYFRFDGQRQVVQMTPFQDDYGLEWWIVTMVPQSYFVGAIQNNTQHTLLLSLLTLGAALAIGQVSTALLTKRFAEINQASHSLALGNIASPLSTNGLIYELNHLAQTHNRMREQLQQFTTQIQTALQESEEKFTTVFRNNPSPMSITTLAEGRILEVNESLLAFFGYSREEVIGRTALELDLWVDLAERVTYRRLLEQQEYVRDLEVHLRTKAGAIKTALLSADVHIFEGRKQLVIVHRDISDRKAAELALQESEARFRALAETVQQGFFVFEVETAQYSYLNSALVALMGTPNPASKDEPSCIAGMSHWFDHVHSEDRDRVQAALQREREGETFDEEYRFIKPDGEVRWLRSRAFPLRDEQGKVFRIVGTVDDMTERRQVEETLREREAMLRAIGDSLPKGFIYQCVYEPGKPGCRYTYISAGVERLLGLKPEAIIADASVMRTVGFEEEYTYADQVVRESIRNLTPIELQMRNRTATGETQWSSIREKPRLLEDGRTVSVGIEVDITDLKRTEASLREREAMLRAIGDNLPKGFIYQFVHHPNQGFYYSHISAGIQRIVGMPPEAIMENPNHLLDSLFEEDRLLYHQLTQQSLESLSMFEMQMRLQTTSGDIQWLSVVAVPRRAEDNCTIWDGVAVDITTFKQAEAALKESAELFQQAFDNAPIGVSMVSPTGQFLKVNQSYCDLLGYTEQELLNLQFQDVTHPDDLEKDLEGVQKLLTGEIRSLYLEKRYISHQGVPIPVLMSAALIRDSEGQPLYILGQVQDIRDRLQVEQMKDEFISVISHELRTPLTSIQGALDILESGIYHDRPDQAQRMLHIAIRNSERLAGLTNEILNLERLDSGKVQLVKEPCQVAELMQQTVEGVLAIAEQAGIILSYTPLVCQLSADASAMIQALSNLLSNAIKFSSAGSTVWLMAEYYSNHSSEQQYPESVLSSPSGHPLPFPYLLFTVKDQGRGIPEEKLETIFEPFQQVDASDSRQKGGTGLGLAICKRIVNQHQGKIWVESSLGQGSSFYIALPLDKTNE